MRIFVINLDISKERLKNFTKRANEQKVLFERVEGIYGNTLNMDELVKKGTISGGISKRPRDAGCSLSHIKIYEKIVREKIDKALIMEDDVIFNPKFNDNIKTIIGWANKEIPTFDFIFCSWNQHLVPKKSITKKTDHFCRLENDSLRMGMYTYIISYEGAKKALQNLHPLTRNIDIQLGGNLKIYGLISRDQFPTRHDWSVKSVRVNGGGRICKEQLILIGIILVIVGLIGKRK